MKYKVLNIVTSPRDGEFFTELLWSEDCLGFQEEESGGNLIISAWFEADITGLEERIKTSARDLGLVLTECSGSIQDYDPEEWLKSFSSSFSGVNLEEEFFIHPPWVEPSAEIPINILLEPGHAFGTGTHESTQLALLAMKPVLENARSFLDVGTGSGILAAAAGKISPGLDISICDIDPVAVDCAVETLQNNHLAEFNAVIGGPEVFSGRVFQVVAANLTSPVIIGLHQALTSLSDEYLILSGITGEQRDFTLEKFLEKEFVLYDSFVKNGWVSCCLRRVS